jgi:predicted DNA-binding transcriptional regulator YafY
MNLQEQINLLRRVDQLIRLKATGTPKGLAQRLGMSESTLYRVIDEMKCMDFPIAYDKQQQSYYYEKEVRFSFEVSVFSEAQNQEKVDGENFSGF